MNIATCKLHGSGLFTEPGNRQEKSYCMKCVANGIRQRPKDFILTESFRRMLERIEKR